MNTIGKNIAERRRALGMTQETLAEKVGVSAQAVSKWENDMTEPDARMLLTLSDLFGTSVDNLLRGTELPEVSNDLKKPEERTVKIRVTAEDLNVTVRVPAALILEGDFSVFDSIVRENAPDVPTSLLDGQIEMIKKFLTSNTVGDVIDVNENGSHITISIE